VTLSLSRATCAARRSWSKIRELRGISRRVNIAPEDQRRKKRSGRMVSARGWAAIGSLKKREGPMMVGKCSSWRDP